MPEPVDIFGHLKAANGCVIAETACGHDGDLEKLTQLIDSVAESGTKFIKFQLFYLEERALESEEEWHIFGRLLLQDEQWEKAVGYARSRQLGVITDVYGERSLTLAKRLGVDGFKVHSEDLLNSYFIARVAEEGQLLLISVGGASPASHRDPFRESRFRPMYGATREPTGSIRPCLTGSPAQPRAELIAGRT